MLLSARVAEECGRFLRDGQLQPARLSARLAAAGWPSVCGASCRPRVQLHEPAQLIDQIQRRTWRERIRVELAQPGAQLQCLGRAPDRGRVPRHPEQPRWHQALPPPARTAAPPAARRTAQRAAPPAPRARRGSGAPRRSPRAARRRAAPPRGRSCGSPVPRCTACRNTMPSPCSVASRCTLATPGTSSAQRGQLEVVRGEQREGAHRSARCAAPPPRPATGRRRCWCRGRSRPSAPGCARVALCRMLAVSVISTMKVERPPARSSPAPMRVKMRSSGPMRRALRPARSCRCAPASRSAPPGACRWTCRPCSGR